MILFIKTNTISIRLAQTSFKKVPKTLFDRVKKYSQTQQFLIEKLIMMTIPIPKLVC